MTTGSAASVPAARQTGTAKEAERAVERPPLDRPPLDRPPLDGARRTDENSFYPIPPPCEVWPRVFPQL